MSLLSRFFCRNSQDGLLEFVERVYVFDSCFSTEVLPNGLYQIYLHEIIVKLHEAFPGSSFLAFNFREGKKQSYFAEILCEYDVTVLDYPCHFEGCPILPLSLIQHFLRVCESWLSLGNQQNVILIHCERGGWPLLAFLLASFLIFRKLHSGERRTLEIVHREAPKGYLQLLSPLNPFPSQLRYLQYVSRRNMSPEWPPPERALSLDCLILCAIPSFDSEKGCRPVIRIFGRRFLSKDELSTQMLFSMSKKRTLRHYRQADSDAIKIDIQCLVQGDVVLECVHWDLDQGKEVMMFRIMFNTAFIQSNILILNSENLDILWDSKERFPKDFRAGVLFGEADHFSPIRDPTTVLDGEEKGGLPVEAFSGVQELFGGVGQVDNNDDAAWWLQKQHSVITDDKELSRLQNKASSYASPGDSKEEYNLSSTPDSSDAFAVISTASEDPKKSLLSTIVDSLLSFTECDCTNDMSVTSPDLDEALIESSPLSVSTFEGNPPYSSPPAPLLGPFACSPLPPPLPFTSLIGSQENSSMSVRPSVALPPPLPPTMPCSSAPHCSSLDSSVSIVPKPPSPPPPPPATKPPGAAPRPPPPANPMGAAPQPSPPLPPTKPLGAVPPPPLPPPPAKPPAATPPSLPPAKPSGEACLLLPPPPLSRPKPLAPPSPPPLILKHSGVVPPPPQPPAKAPLPRSRGAGSGPPSPPGAKGSKVPLPPPISAGKGRASLGLTSLGRGRGSSTASNAPKKSSLKRLYWEKVTRALQGSLWADSQKQENQSRAPEIDISELESLFSAASASGGGSSEREGGRHGSSLNKLEKVQLVDLRRACICEMMLAKIKIPLSDMINAVLALDSSVLDIGQVEDLIRFCPTEKEMEVLKSYTGDKNMLGQCEQFFLQLMKVPRVQSKLRVFAFKITFLSQVKDLRTNLNIINDASREVKESVKLRQIMQTILTLGNALNQGTPYGSARGFKLDSLLKLSEIRARNKEMTLLHYLCKLLAEKMPELLDFSKDLVHLEAASKIELKPLAKGIRAASKGLETVKQELTASENDGGISAGFQKVLCKFRDTAEAEVRSLISLHSEVERNGDSMSQYLGENPAERAFQKVMEVLFVFVKMFDEAREENVKQAEVEKQRLEKEAMKRKAAANLAAKEEAAKNEKLQGSSPLQEFAP